MKWAIYLLLLANIGFFVWHFQMPSADKQSAVETAYVEEGAVKLMMLKEFAQLQGDTDSAPKLWCHALGPFEKESNAKQMEVKLVQEGFPVNLHRSTEAKKKGYWVLLPPYDDFAKAKSVANTLKSEHKIKDLFIVTTGEMKNGISLGVFSRFELAYRRQNDINTRGFTAAVEEVQLPAKVFWLEWAREYEGKIPQTLLDESKTLNSAISKIEKECNKG